MILGGLVLRGLLFGVHTRDPGFWKLPGACCETEGNEPLFSLPHFVGAAQVFSTDIGLRAAEPCSLSVVATHQMLTQILKLGLYSMNRCVGFLGALKVSSGTV